MRFEIIPCLLALAKVGTSSPAQHTLTSSTTAAPVPTPAKAVARAADDEATTTITLASAQTVLVSVPGNEPYTALPEQGYVQLQIAEVVNFVVDYENPSSTVSTVTKTVTVERRVDFCTTTSTIGIS
ncbi:hypothetical protein Daus18300_007522 [Diaporthe australafricana]|uniref:Uncharacterized protein n=1 Tax=Diaporthe australafricana TaxID=127596 RepID=A0ABR3WMQ4_9PEZI